MNNKSFQPHIDPNTIQDQYVNVYALFVSRSAVFVVFITTNYLFKKSKSFFVPLSEISAALI